MPSKLKRTTMNISIDPEIKTALEKIPKWERPTTSAYVIGLIVRDLKRRKLLPKSWA